MKRLSRISRREFLQRTGVAGGGLVFALHFGPLSAQDEQGSDSVAPNVYVNIREDNKVEIYCHRSEMGQGIRTCLPQVIADELGADWDQIELIQAPGDARYGDQNTDGSTSIRKHFDLLRNAGATGRELLIAAAAANWDIPASELTARDNAIHHESTGRSASFGSLVTTAAGLEVPENVTFKDPADYRYIGKSVDLIDGFDMTTGQADYGIDTAVPGMLYASIERPPAWGGKVSSFDDAAAKSVAGVEQVIQMPDATTPAGFNPVGGVAVLATNTWSAQQGRAKLNIEWNMGPNAGYDSEAYRARMVETSHQEGNLVLARGDVDAAFDSASNTLEADYYAPHLSHATMEPPAATARMKEDGGIEIWAATQHPQAVQGTVAGLLGIEPSQVEVHVTLLGGAFGRKSKADFSAEAAWLASKSGRPVKVTYTREDDVRHGYYHSVSAQYLKAGLDDEGNTTAWLHRTVFPSIFSTFDPENTGPVTMELGLGFTDNPFDVPNMRLESGDAQAHIRIGWLRSVSNIYHAFAICGFADELAHQAGADPRDYLLKLVGSGRQHNPADHGAEYPNYDQDLDDHPIDSDRYAAVLNRVAEMADWGRDMPHGEGLGIAVHRSFLSTIGTVAHVKVDDAGKMQVQNMWFAVDAGLVINPDRVISQMEGAGIFGMSLAMFGEITAKDGVVVQDNYNNYQVVRMNQAPANIHVDIMNLSEKPGGVGEPGVPPVAPAIVNAYFAATGKRIRELPLSKAGLV